MDLELERTYLVKKMPGKVTGIKPVEIKDIYFPPEDSHPVLRLRKRGERYEMTKKTCLHGSDSSEQQEDTIKLTAAEFNALANAPGKQLSKQRYTYHEGNVTVDIDVFLGDLTGLVLVDFEFASVADKNSFVPPDWCLAEVTQDAAIAGGKLAGKHYAEIEDVIAKYQYAKIERVDNGRYNVC